MLFRTKALLSSLALAVLVLHPNSARGESVALARDLAPSPDGRTLAFSSAGDVWVVPIEGGDARRLTVNPADDGHPVWSPDGSHIAFESDRHGASNVFVMTHDGDDVRRLTYSDRPETPSGWAADGQTIYFQARKTGEASFESRVWRVPARGGQSTRVMDCMGANAVENPSGTTIAFSRGWSPLERTGYHGSANHDIWLHERVSGKFTQLTTFDGTDALPQWDGAGRGVYFLSDRDGNHNVWYQPIGGGPAVQITACQGERVRDFGVSRDGRTLAYAQWDKVYVASLPEIPSAPVTAHEIMIDASDDSSNRLVEFRTFSRDADECEVSPDGKEVALVVRGEIYVIKTDPEKPTRRVTDSAARDRSVTWSPDGKALFFVSDRDGYESIYRAKSAEAPTKALSDSLRFKIERVTQDPRTDHAPVISPDGKQMAFVRERGDLMLRDLKSGAERAFFKGWSTPTVRWSPDSKWLAYDIEDNEFNADIWVAPVEGSAPPVNISRHPDNDNNPQWSADGQIIAFTSRRLGPDNDLYYVFLSPELEEKSNVDLNEYFEKAAEKVKKRKPPTDCVASGDIALGPPPATQSATSSAAATTSASAPASSAPTDKPAASQPSIEEQLRTLLREFIKEPEKEKKDKKDEKKEDDKAAEYAYDLDTAWKRIRRFTALPEDQVSFALNPDGASVSFVSGHEGSPALFTVKWNGEDRKKAISAAVSNLHWTLDGQRLFYLKNGAPASSKEGGGDAKDHGFSAKMSIVRAEEAAQKWDDAARALGMGFYHPTLKGLDWSALSAKYKALAVRTVTWDEFNEVFELFQGLLNGSHLGIRGPARGTPSDSVGYLGCDFDQTFPGPGLKVASIVPLSPADRAERLNVGDVQLKVNGQPVRPDASIDRALLASVNDQIIVELTPSPAREAAEAAAKAKKASKEKAKGDEGKSAGESASSQPVTRPGGEAEAGAEREKSTKTAAIAENQKPASSSQSTESAPATREIVMRPISYGAFSGLAYQAWVDDNTRFVDEKSGGRVAYLHISGMAEPQFHTFERDLYAIAHGKDALIIDVRNNGGGWTADWVMAVLEVRRHAYTIARGGEPGYPQDRLIFYSWTKPTVMMCNQYSYSNAEIVSHAFKTLKRGPLVGMTTFGAVISTGSYSLIDGTTIRMPFRGWYLPDGTDMEGHGAVPDVLVAQTPEDEEAGAHAQLEAAVKAALAEVDRQKAASSPGGAATSARP